MDNLEGIVGCDLRFGPAIARENIEVTLNRDALGRDAQVSEQAYYIQAIGNLPLVAIDRDFHACGPAGEGFCLDRSA